MEASGDDGCGGDEAAELPEGPLTSTPKESLPSSEPPSEPPRRTDSSTSLSSSSESSGEEWLIKVCCPGARHRYRRYAKNKKRMPSHQKAGLPDSLDVADALTKAREWMPITSYKVHPGVSKKESLDLQWLIRLRCPRALMEEMTPEAKESLPSASTSLSKSPSKTRSSPPEKYKISENWLTQKRFSIAQALVNERQDMGSTQSQLDRGNCFVREVDRYLKHSDFLALRRKEMLYKKWFENVSKPLHQKIQDKIDKKSSEEIEERKRKQLSHYLNHCNKKGVVSLENYNPSSYDPFFLKTPDISKVSVPPLCDPLLKEIQDRYLEAGIIQQCETGRILSAKEMNELRKAELPLLPMSRQLMSPIEWLKIPARYMDSEIRLRSQRKMVPTRNQCSMDFRSWGDPSWASATKRRISVRKPDGGRASTPMTKQILLGSSGRKPPIKSAS
ncbi:protein FAM228B-like isoform X1 [Anolis sagrei]|uniref:protein FAM228B-like isoform X1 n=1 Tax=Anolis sagrei TaxID=38937 RepID=UPI003520AF50